MRYCFCGHSEELHTSNGCPECWRQHALTKPMPVAIFISQHPQCPSFRPIPGGWFPIGHGKPRDARWIRVANEKVCYIAHWADGGGEDQSRFRGWFIECGGYFGELPIEPLAWQPISC